MNQALRITAIGVCACLFAGCNSFPELSRTESDGPAENPRAAVQAKIDEFVKNYVEPETDIPTEFAPEFKNTPEYPEMSQAARKAFQGIGLFRQAKNLNSIDLKYESMDKTQLKICAKRIDHYIEISIDKDGKNLFLTSAELPEIKVRPPSIPQDQEEFLCRDLFMIHSFLLNPMFLAKTVSMDTIKNINYAKKIQEYENQEFLVDGHLCSRMNISLRDMFGGGRMVLYLAAGPFLECLSGVEIPALSLDPSSNSAFSFFASDYAEQKNGLILPTVIRFRDKLFVLKSADAEIILPPAPAPAEQPAAGNAASSPEVKKEDAKKEPVVKAEDGEDVDKAVAEETPADKDADEELETDEETEETEKAETDEE